MTLAEILDFSCAPRLLPREIRWEIRGVEGTDKFVCWDLERGVASTIPTDKRRAEEYLNYLRFPPGESP